MLKNFDGQAFIAPLPVLIVATYGEDGRPCAMNVAWGGQCGPKHIALNLGSHQTTDNIKAKGAFTVSLADAAHVVEADYFGIVSGRKVADKIGTAGMTVKPGKNVDAPVIQELPVTMECKVVSMEPKDGGSYRIVGEVVNTWIDEAALSEDGKLDQAAAKLIAFDSCTYDYRLVGESVGVAWQSGKQLM